MSPFANRPFKVAGASFGIRAAEDVDQEPAARRQRHELPAAAGLGVVGECGFERGRRVELGFPGGSEEFDGLVEAAQADGFFFDAADEVVEIVAGGFRERVEEPY